MCVWIRKSLYRGDLLCHDFDCPQVNCQNSLRARIHANHQTFVFVDETSLVTKQLLNKYTFTSLWVHGNHGVARHVVADCLVTTTTMKFKFFISRIVLNYVSYFHFTFITLLRKHARLVLNCCPTLICDHIHTYSDTVSDTYSRFRNFKVMIVEQVIGPGKPYIRKLWCPGICKRQHKQEYNYKV